MREVVSTAHCDKPHNRFAQTPIICALVCVGLLMAGCGGGAEEPTPVPTEPPAPTSATAPTDPPEETTEDTAAEPQSEPTDPPVEEASTEEYAGRPPAELWNANACVACHNLAENQTDSNRGPVGPHLGNLHENAGARVAGQDALTYVITSIVEPNAYINEGYVEGVMLQNYGEAMTEAEVAALAEWLLDPNRSE